MVLDEGHPLWVLDEGRPKGVILRAACIGAICRLTHDNGQAFKLGSSPSFLLRNRRSRGMSGETGIGCAPG